MSTVIVTAVAVFGLLQVVQAVGPPIVARWYTRFVPSPESWPRCGACSRSTWPALRQRRRHTSAIWSVGSLTTTLPAQIQSDRACTGSAAEFAEGHRRDARPFREG